MRRPWAYPAVAALALLAPLALQPVAAQDTSAAPISLDVTKIYAHRSTAGSDETSGWMNSLADDGDDTAMGPAAACNNNPAGVAGVPFTGQPAVDDVVWGEAIDRIYTLTLTPGLADTVTLDPTKPVSASIAFGATSCGGHPDLESTLKSGDTVIASGTASHAYTPGSPYPVASVAMAIAGQTIQPGAPLVWTIHVTGTFYGAGFMGVADPQGHTFLDLPVVPTPVPIVTTYHALSGATADAVIPESAASGIQVYNWTTTLTTVEAAYSATVKTGTAHVTVKDGAGAAVLDETLGATGAHQKILDGVAGAWQIVVEFTDFQGSVEIHLAAPAPPAGSGSSSSTSGAESTSGEETGGSDTSSTAESAAAPESATTSSAKGSPGWPVPAAVGALAMLAVLRRRGQRRIF